MDYERLSEEKLDDIMAAIRRENGKAEATRSVPASASPAPAGAIERNAHLEDAQNCMDEAVVGTQIGYRRAPMYKKRGLARKIARVIELVYLRVAEFTNRDLRDFCGNVLGVFRVILARIERLFMNDQILEDRIASLELRIVEQDALIAQLKQDNASLSQSLSRSSSEQSALRDALADVRGRQDGLSAGLRELTKEKDYYASPAFSGLYHDFEERFRGSAEDISARLEVYRYLLVSKIGPLEGRHCVDLGCGRGEMLDFYRKSGVSERVGVDLNAVQLAICAGKGHETVQADCFDYLSSLPDNSVDVISAIQLIEHLSFEELIRLTRECYRVLRRGGAVLFETPNCENLITAATWFRIDPTHINPVHPALMKFIGEREGFADTEIIGVNADEYAGRLDASAEGAETLNSLLFGARDYAFIGVKR